jgi:hypothetical protein
LIASLLRLSNPSGLAVFLRLLIDRASTMTRSRLVARCAELIVGLMNRTRIH